MCNVTEPFLFHRTVLCWVFFCSWTEYSTTSKVFLSFLLNCPLAIPFVENDLRRQGSNCVPLLKAQHRSFFKELCQNLWGTRPVQNWWHHVIGKKNRTPARLCGTIQSNPGVVASSFFQKKTGDSLGNKNMDFWVPGCHISLLFSQKGPTTCFV